MIKKKDLWSAYCPTGGCTHLPLFAKVMSTARPLHSYVYPSITNMPTQRSGTVHNCGSSKAAHGACTPTYLYWMAGAALLSMLAGLRTSSSQGRRWVGSALVPQSLLQYCNVCMTAAYVLTVVRLSLTDEDLNTVRVIKNVTLNGNRNAHNS